MIPASMLVSNPTMGKLAQELAERKVCRICLIESDKLVDVLNGHQWSVILTTCFASSKAIAERLPKFVCESCSEFLGKCREFKQMCKKTELMLVSYPLTGSWPESIEVPNWLRPVQKRQLQQNDEDAVSTKKARNTSDESTVLVQCNPNTSPIGTIRVRTNEALTSLQSPTISSEMQFSLENTNSNAATVIQYCQNQQPQNSYQILPQYSQHKPSSSCSLLKQQLQQASSLPPPMNSVQYTINSLTQQVPYQQQQQQQPQQQPPQQYQQLGPQQLTTQQPTLAVPLQQPSEQPVPSNKIRLTTTATYGPMIQQVAPMTLPPLPTNLFQCTACSYVFANQNHLMQHMRKHLGNGEYHCGCGHKFFQLDAFVHHLKQHTNILWCGLCGEQFPADWQLSAHLDKHTLVGLSQACDFCPLVFIDQPSRLQHVGRKHKEDVRQVIGLNPTKL